MISLGLNYSQMHDSAACIARDGEVLFAIAEERLSRRKHDARFPERAVQACLDFAGLRMDEVSHVCLGWSPARAGFLHDLCCYGSGKQHFDSHALLNTTRYFLSMWHQQGGAARLRQKFGSTNARFMHVDHHLAHAISAYAYSGFDDAAVLVIDGRGAWEATSLWRGRDGRLEHIWTIRWPNSLGLFYAQFTDYLGFQPYSDEWKVMGLAPYGEPGINLDEFLMPDAVPYRIAPRLLLGGHAAPLAGIEARFGRKRKPESDIEARHKNLAFAVQDYCERAMLALAKFAVERTGCRNLCLAGGVALNSKANGKLLTSGAVEQMFIQPAASDDGACLGAALAPLQQNGGQLPVRRMRHAYLGPEFRDPEIESVLQAYKITFRKSANPAASAAELISNGKIIGWFQGRMEFGPRALGSRSILADPRDPEMGDHVNNAVKFREAWRPFAPSFLAESAGEYLESAADSPFMVLTAQVKPEKRAVIPAVTHADGSTRPQTVERDVNPLYWRVICELGQRTGVPVVMNTSFNLRGEPIVCTPTDAVRTFFSSGMDALVIGSFVVEK
ncbi:MAG TPA: carbamoyltransferase C-terminal domain-containing protein [Candidatus Acidoferrales bacterium]|nr:carbamoyltransferase C-terminal domain-containing protein [Candidatus Acidoferrales bacterium]